MLKIPQPDRATCPNSRPSAAAGPATGRQGRLGGWCEAERSRERKGGGTPGRAPAAGEGAHGYFVMENMKVFEIDLMPEGADGLNVTNAE
jgi:hypothetical protein